MRNILPAALVLTWALSSVAEAREHHVIITALGFFPQVTYVAAGDVVFFKNDGDITHELTGSAGSQSLWDVKVPPNDWGMIYVTDAADIAYNSVTAPLEDGVLSFAPPPEKALAN